MKKFNMRRHFRVERRDELGQIVFAGKKKLPARPKPDLSCPSSWFCLRCCWHCSRFWTLRSSLNIPTNLITDAA